MHFRDIYIVVSPYSESRAWDLHREVTKLAIRATRLQGTQRSLSGTTFFDGHTLAEITATTSGDVTIDPDDGTMMVHVRSAFLRVSGVELLKGFLNDGYGTVISWTSPNWSRPGHHTAAMKKRHAHARLLEEERDRAARERAQMERLRKAAAKVPAPKLVKKLPRARAFKEALRENPYPREAANRTAARRGARRIGYGVYNVFQHYWWGQNDPLYAVLSRRGGSVDWVEVTLSAAERRRMDEVATTILSDEGTTAAEKRTARSWLTPR